MTEKKAVDRTRRQKYTSTRGVVAWFTPMPVVLQGNIHKQMEEEGLALPPVPTYEAEVLGGVTEKHEYDEVSVAQAVEEGDEEAQKLWDEYLKGTDDYNTEFSIRLARAVQVLCMEVEGIDDEEWVKKWEGLGFKVPEDPVKKKLFFIENEFVGSNEDSIAMMQFPIRLTLERTGALQIVEDMFRQPLVERETPPENIEADLEEE